MVLGILAGGGTFPILAAKKAKEKGARVVAVGIEGSTSADLYSICDGHEQIRFGQLSKMINFFKKEGAQGVMLAGNLDHAHALGAFDQLKLLADPRVLKLLVSMRERNATTLLTTLIQEIENEGMRVLPSYCYLEEELVKPGAMTEEPSADQKKDIETGRRIAKELARMDVGLTVCVDKGAVLAVEALEGTDACIERAGQILRQRRKGEDGFVVAKVARPKQDPRFDLPVIGPKTIQSMVSAGARVLAVEAGWTLILEKAETLEAAKRHKIILWGFDSPRQTGSEQL